MTKKEDKKSWVQTVSLTPPALQDNTADIERLLAALKSRLRAKDADENISIEIDFDLLKTIPGLLRKWNYKACCVLFKNRGNWVLIKVFDPDKSASILGLAVDLGTTRVVLRLIELHTDQVKGELAFDNPQLSVGPDILARIHFAEQENGLNRLNHLIIDGFNKAVLKICGSCNSDPEDIYLLAVAGNTAMTHLFMGLDPHWIIREPYIPAVNSPGTVKAKDLGIKVNPSARALIFPNIGSYFGGDLISGIMFSGLNESEDTTILVDVGTNAEVVLGNKNWLIACAGAAGPALEGGVTKMGMMAGPGVIDGVFIDPVTKNITIHSIDDKEPIGICGSGLIDLAAGLFTSGMIDIRGKFTASAGSSRLMEKDGIKHFVIVPSKGSATGEDLTISQTDLDSLIRSKAAMYTILETITSSVGVSFSDLFRFYVAGTFGSFIKPESAIAIGMIPDLPVEKYKPLGNSSLGGAVMALTSTFCFDEIEKIRNQITYMELNVNQEFMNLFSAAKFLPHTDLSLFPSVKINHI